MFIMSKMKCNSEKNINKHVIASDRKGAWQSKKYAFTLSCKSFRSGLDSLLHLWCSKARNPRKPSFAAAHSYGFTLSCKSFRSGLDSLLHLWCSKARNPRKPGFAAAHSYGFTLTEVIVVIVIIAALALILIPNMLKMMPDDHNIKYKKAFYTIQEIVNDIASECQGLNVSGGEWEEASNPENVLNYCYNSDETSKNLADEICERLNTTTECTSSYPIKIQTTNGMNWWLASQVLSTAFEDDYILYVSVNGTAFGGTAPSFGSSDISSTQDNGFYRIIIKRTGKVQTPTDGKEQGYLLKKPTDD